MSSLQQKSTEILPKKTQTLDLPDKDFKSATINMLKEVKESISKELKQVWKQHRLGTSLVVQWLILHVPNVGDRGSIPGWVLHATHLGHKKEM